MNDDEFKFLIVNTSSLWQERKATDDSIGITEEGIAIGKDYTHVFTESYPLEEISPADFALDYCGLLYILDSKEKRLVIFDTSAGTYHWIEGISFSKPRAITLDRFNIYVADGRKVYCLAEANYQTRWKTSIRASQLIDMALDSKKDLYVLDRKSRQVFKIDKTAKASPVKLTEEGNPYQLDKPVNIAIDKDDNLYLLEYSKKEILKFNSDGEFEGKAEFDFDPAGLAVDQRGNIFIGDKRPSGFPYQFSPTCIAQEGTAEVKGTQIGYQGAAHRLVLSQRGDLYILNRDKNEIAFLKLIEGYVSQGTYITKSFDSNIPDCQWHKVVVDADIPANTRMSVYYHTSNDNDKTSPSEMSWSEAMVNFEDALILSTKGRYIWFKIELSSDDLHSASPQIRSLKVYFPRQSYLRYLPATYQEDEAKREFLERFLSLFETPFSNMEDAIRTLTRYIDAGAAPDSFLPWLSSWLAIAYDESWTEGKGRELIEKAPELYKKRGTRASIEELIELYTGEKPIIVENFQLRLARDKPTQCKLAHQVNRGESQLTLADASPLEAGEVIKIGDGTKEEFAVIEYKEGNTLRLRGKISSDYNAGIVVRKVRIEEVLFGDCPYSFCVLLRPYQVKTTTEFNAVNRIIEREKPAHTVGGLKALQPGIYLGMHTYLEINTILAGRVFTLGDRSVISRDTVLADREGLGQVG
jgi:phage tail-like protein